MDDLPSLVELTFNVEQDPCSPDFACGEKSVEGRVTWSILSACVKNICLGLPTVRMIKLLKLKQWRMITSQQDLVLSCAAIFCNA